MKKLLIIKCGETFPQIKKKFGDFDEMIQRAAGVLPDAVMVSPVYQDIHSLPPMNDVGAIIITGSHSMVTNQVKWSVCLMKWLQPVRQMMIPTLGICYGHQLLAEAFGGKVHNHPKGIEIGTAHIQLTQEGKNDPLFNILSHSFFGHVTHYQSILKLPEQATILAKNDFEPYQAYALDNHIWGVQFHPEFTADIIRSYIDEQAERLMADGYNIEEIFNQVKTQEYGPGLLERFVKLAGF